MKYFSWNCSPFLYQKEVILKCNNKTILAALCHIIACSGTLCNAYNTHSHAPNSISLDFQALHASLFHSQFETVEGEMKKITKISISN